MRGRLILVVGLSLAVVSCTYGDGGGVDVGATARSSTVAAAATRGAVRLAEAERVRDELSDAVNRARNLHSGLLLLRLQMTQNSLTDAAEATAQQAVLAACDDWPGQLALDLWPPEYRDFYAATGTSCEGVQSVLGALRENASDATVRDLWLSVVTDLTITSGFDIELGLLLARLPSYSQTDLLRAILARQ
jgi:hypothetical protein